MSSGKKRGGAPPPKPNSTKRFQTSTSPAAATPPTPALPATMEEEMMDEDVYLEETLLKYEEDEEALLLLRDEAHSFRLSKWRRPTLSSGYLSSSESIVFQQLEIDYIIGESRKELLPNWSGPAAILRIFGVTREGHSVCCHVHGFEPYFYICCPPGMGPDDISRFHQALEGRMKESNRNSNVPRFVKRVELVQRKSIMYYQPQNLQPFLKIVVALPTMVASCRGILERGITIDGLGSKSFVTYESNILFALRFMIDCNIVGGNWIEVPSGKYKKSAKIMTYCQLEVDALYPSSVIKSSEVFTKGANFGCISLLSKPKQQE